LKLKWRGKGGTEKTERGGEGMKVKNGEERREWVSEGGRGTCSMGSEE